MRSSSAGVAPRGRVPAIGCVVMPVAHDLEQELGAGADDLERRRPGEEQVRRRVDPPQRAIQADAVDGRAVGGVGEVERLAPGEDDLDRLAGRDRVLGVLDRADVRVAAEATCRPRGTRSRSPRRRSGWTARRPPPSRPGSGGPSARGPRRSPARRSGSGRRGRAPRCAARRSPTAVWLRWSNTMTRSVSMKPPAGRRPGPCPGSGTDGSNAPMASYASAPTAPPVNRGMPSVGRTRRFGTKARSAASGSGASVVVTGQVGGVASTPTGAGRRAGDAVADLEQPPRADAQEAVAARGARRPRRTRAGRRA